MMTTVSSCSRSVAEPNTDAASAHQDRSTTVSNVQGTVAEPNTVAASAHQERSCPRGECHVHHFARTSTWLLVSMPLSGKNDDCTRVIPMISEMVLLETGNRDDNVTAMIQEIFVKSV